MSHARPVVYCGDHIREDLEVVGVFDVKTRRACSCMCRDDGTRNYFGDEDLRNVCWFDMFIYK